MKTLAAVLLLLASLPAFATGPQSLPTTKPDGSPLVGPYPKGPDHKPYFSGNRLPGCPDNDRDCDGSPQGSDCNDGDPFISPNLPEYPFNEFDDDCDPKTPDKAAKFSYVVQTNPMGVYTLYQGTGGFTLLQELVNGVHLCAWEYNYDLVAKGIPNFYYAYMKPGKPFTYFWTSAGIWRTLDGIDIRPANQQWGPFFAEPLDRDVP